MNAFEQLAELQIPAPRKARQRAAEKRAEKAQTEKKQQLAVWRAWRKERREALLAGPHAQAARELAGLLDTLTLNDGDELIERVRRGPWREADADTRFQILSLIDNALIALRERHGLAPIDDALPGEEPNVFLVLREELT